MINHYKKRENEKNKTKKQKKNTKKTNEHTIKCLISDCNNRYNVMHNIHIHIQKYNAIPDYSWEKLDCH